MPPNASPDAFGQTTMKEYRKNHREKRKELLRSLAPKFEDCKIVDILVIPRLIDMKDFRGSEKEMRETIEYLYTNDGRAFEPITDYPPSMIDIFGKEYALNARGIYYFNDFRVELITVGRKVWIPSFGDIDWENPSEWDRRKRARIIMEHNLDNETRHKSEYAWEADAWADVFNQMRNDPYLEVDKHDYFTPMPKTHPVLCTLTGESTIVNRIPDATFGLATFSDQTSGSAVQTDELTRERLERLLLHPKCGLIGDPKWGETDLVFPFAVYEAKGWSGDCREARRQACQAGACYLDMLDNLVRKPGPVDSAKGYQTKTSHQYQVFALTSFGAHWHLLVGYQRPRQLDEYAGHAGMSQNVYIFQRVWSARITNERAAWELLSLVDQIHLWAITDFRTFVTEHLKSWHSFCDENYLLDWKSVYDVKPELKQIRTCSEGPGFPLPSWVKLLNDPMQRRIQARAQKFLYEALEKNRQRKGKGRAEMISDWRCGDVQCFSSEQLYTSEAFLEHHQDTHCCPENELTQTKKCLNEADYEVERECEMGKELDNGASDGLFKNKKRCFDGEDRFDGIFSNSPSDGTSGPSKRARVT